VVEIGKNLLYIVGGCFLLANVLGSLWMVRVVIAAMVESTVGKASEEQN
jgi:hypothetical protein